jgi:hypothetical protein
MIASIFFIFVGPPYRDDGSFVPLAQRLARTMPVRPESSNVAPKLPAEQKFDFRRQHPSANRRFVAQARKVPPNQAV